MIINKNISGFVVFSDEPLSLALQKISANKSGVVFILDQSGVLEGILTDGDFRRWLLNSRTFDLALPVVQAANPNCTVCQEGTQPEEVARLFSDRIRHIPLIDRQKRLVAIALHETDGFRIDRFLISDSSPTFLIAEIGNNHQGSIEMAIRLINEAVAAGATCAKFQMRHMDSLYRKPSADEDLGAEYTLDLLARFQLNNDDLFKAFDYCKKVGILPLCTPWDLESLSVLERYGLPAYKLASADLTNHELLDAMCSTGKPLICSTGMSSESEISEAIRLLNRKGAPFALLHCNSTYPAPFKDVQLNYLTRLKSLGGGCPVGYSSHERGYSVPIAAVAMGARIIEKHFTLDRGLEGNDHKVSLLPGEFAEMVRAVREVELALGTAEPRRMTQGEMMNREVLGKSLVAKTSIDIGELIGDEVIEVRGPGRGLTPSRRAELVGQVARRKIQAGDFFYASDIEGTATEARAYRFNRPFGIPVRYHDVTAMTGRSNFDLLEFHLSYKDMELRPSDYLDPAGYDLDFVVHSPELFAGDHVMDLSSPDSAYRNRSCQELQRVIDITRSLKDYFRKAQRPLIIINAGGFTSDGFMPLPLRRERYELIARAIESLDAEGVEIIPQTMPPFPWHFGGQRFHNLFMDADEIVEYCASHGSRVCLDISHSKLACNHSGGSFKVFLEKVAPYSVHLHMVDAEGVDGEGLQIGTGGIDFAVVAEQLDKGCPSASFIPEIWQGHKNAGEGFWIALERLEKVMSANAVDSKS